MRSRGSALQTALDCLCQGIDVRRDAFKMAAYQGMHCDLWREPLPLSRNILAATDYIVREQQRDGSVIGPWAVTC